MITIPVTVTGDHWLNPDQVMITLALSDPQETVILDICAEGPSLRRLGVIDTVMAHCHSTGRLPDTVFVTRWSNSVESVPFQRTHRSDVSHFFWLSDRYWPQHIIACEQGHLFGFFMGRPTMARLALLQHLSRYHDAVLSVMGGGTVPTDQGRNADLAEFSGLDRDALAAWYHGCGIASIDGAVIRDQYSVDHNTNQSLLAHYDRFHIEIVAESYVLGDTYFPTEKTVRPLAAGRPMIVMGPRHFLRRLRDQGFQTWQDLWDENYDDLEGAARLDQIKAVIEDVAQRRHSILPHLAAHAQHNRQNVEAIIKRHRPGP